MVDTSHEDATLHDWFAGLASTGLLARHDQALPLPDDVLMRIAAMAYKFGGYMLQQKEMADGAAVGAAIRRHAEATSPGTTAAPVKPAKKLRTEDPDVA